MFQKKKGLVPIPLPSNRAIKNIGKRAQAHGVVEAYRFFFSLNSQVETHILAHAFHTVLLQHMKNPTFPGAAESTVWVFQDHPWNRCFMCYLLDEDTDYAIPFFCEQWIRSPDSLRT